jgi:hypothetical protein
MQSFRNQVEFKDSRLSPGVEIAHSPCAPQRHAKQIVKVRDSKEERLNGNLIRRICYQLDQKCKLELEPGPDGQGQRS